MTKRLLSYLLFLFVLLNVGYGQVVTSVPAMPTDQDLTTLTFNASLGNAGLQGFTGDVYAHIGVITDKSTSDTDWKYGPSAWGDNSAKYKLTRTTTNTYTLTLTPSIRDYFGVAAGEKILKIAMVFRSSDNTKEGKDVGNKDIFVPVYSATLSVDFIKPTSGFFIQHQDSTLNISVSAMFNTTIFLLENGLPLADIVGQSLTYSGKFSVGLHTVVAEVTDATNKVVRDSIMFLVDDMISPALPLPAGLRQGINYISDTEATLVLFAPYKKSVFVVGDFNNWQATSAYKMNKGEGADTAMYWITIPNLIKGKEYGFQYLIDNKIKIADPYTNKIQDPYDDKYIADIVYPGLIKYPEGKTTDRVSVLQTGQAPYNWKVTNFVAPDPKKLVVYELLIRDFQNSTVGTNKQLGYLQQCIDSIDYFKRLGINAIEIMPFNEFEGNISWGYNPSFYFAPDKAYGPAEKYKEFIDLCHQNGIAVIMDMVLNHAFNSCSFAKMYWNDALNRPAANNPWFNEVSNMSNTSLQWGCDFNHQSAYTKQLVDSINSYWMSEYKIDGFRFDFTKGFTNTKYNAASWGSEYDASRIVILERMFDEIRKRNSDAYVIFEHLTDNTEEKVLADHGIMLWGNSTSNYSEASMGYNDSGKSDISWSSYKSRGFAEPRLIPYMESHDEQRQMFKNKTYASVTPGYNAKDLAISVRRSASAAAMYFSIPGPKMVWMFGERGYDVSIDSIGRTDPKPPKWEYMQNPNRIYLFETYSQLIKLKETEPVFATTDFTLSGVAAVKQLSLNMAGSDVRIIANFDVVSQSVKPLFSKTGYWYNHTKGDSVNVKDVDMTFTLAAGEFRIFSEKKMAGYAINTSSEDARLEAISLRVYPQPFTSSVTFEASTAIDKVVIYSISGQIVAISASESDIVVVNTETLPKGIYIAKVLLKNGAQQMRQITK